MELIVAYSDGKEIGFAKECTKIDFDVGDTNDFELTVPERNYSGKYQMGNLIYAPGTEWGGVISDIKTDSGAGTIKILGDTWRGMMAKKILEPPAGSAYLTADGDLNAVLRQIIDGEFSGIIRADNGIAGVDINYSFDRYTDMLAGITKMLKTKNMRLSIAWSDYAGCAIIKAVPVIDFSEEIEFNQDMRIDFTTRDYRRGINHLICLGSGELTERQVVHLYLQGDGTILMDSQYYTGINERTAIYDYPNAESMEEFVAGGQERLKELADYKELSMDIEGEEIEIGDIVGGRDRITGMTMRKPVTGKILRITGNKKESIEYKIGD